MTRALPLSLVALLVVGACSDARDRPRADAGPDTLSLDHVLVVGESLYYRAEYDSARALWDASLTGARAAGDSVRIARLLTWLGLRAWKQGEFGDARRLGEEALALKLRLGLNRELARSYNALGLLAWHEARLPDAVQLLANAVTAARAAADPKAVAVAMANLPLIQMELGEFAEARAGFVTAREAAQELGDPRIEANALTNLGSLAIRVGDANQAIPALAEARRLYRTAGLTAQEQNALGQLGTAYAALGDMGRAFAALDSALDLARAQGLRQEEATNLEALAVMYREAGDFRAALALFAEAKTINTELGLELEEGADLRSAAEIHVALGELKLAWRYGTGALDLHRRIGARSEELADLLLLADLADRSAARRDARAYLEAAGALAARVGTRLARVSTALTAARVADRAGDGRWALSALEAVAPDLARGGYGTEWEAQALRTRALARLGQTERAVEAGRRAVAAVERARGGFGSGFHRTTFAADKSEVYADLVGVLLGLGRYDEALEVSDAARGRVLVEHLVGATGGLTRADSAVRAARAGEERLRHIDGLVTAIDEREAELADEADSAARVVAADLYAKLAQARAEYETYHSRARDVAGSAALLGGAPPDAARIRAALGPDEVMLEYLVAPERVVVFAVTRDGVRAVERGVTADQLAARVRVARDALASPGSPLEAAHPVLGALHETLVQPVAGALAGRRRVIVVPHGALTYLPFAALRDSATGRHLVESHAVVQLPSATALVALRSPRAPAMEAKVPVAVFAPLLDALPATGKEAEAVRHAVEGTRGWLGARATEREVRWALGRARVVHVASHGVLNPVNPMFSRIELARGSSHPENDGRLEVHELLSQRIGSGLVFLSGCETGLGASWSTAFVRGEDFATLAQAFLFAGARNAVATLWRVEDEGAAAFAAQFYRRLGSNESADPVRALAETQRGMLGDPRYRNPYYWAAYALSGAGDFLAPGQRRQTVAFP